MGIAAAMCLMLYKSSGGITKRYAQIVLVFKGTFNMTRSNMIVTTLIQYVVGTGLLTR